jgi:hypothetical protein
MRQTITHTTYGKAPGACANKHRASTAGPTGCELELYSSWTTVIPDEQADEDEMIFWSSVHQHTHGIMQAALDMTRMRMRLWHQMRCWVWTGAQPGAGGPGVVASIWKTRQKLSEQPVASKVPSGCHAIQRTDE